MKKKENSLENLEAQYNKMLAEEKEISNSRYELQKKIEDIKKDLQKKAKKPILKIACFGKQNPDGPALYFAFLATVDLNDPMEEFYMVHEEDEYAAESFKENFYELVKKFAKEDKSITDYDIRYATRSDIRSTMIEGCRDDSTSVILCIEEIDKEEFDNRENWCIPIYRESYDSGGKYDAGITWR